MRELVRTNDLVLISAVGALLDGADIHHLVLDQNMSIVEGSLGPHSWPTLPHWDVLTEGWSTTRWVDRPEGLDIHDIRMPDRTLTAPRSRFLTV